MKHLPNEIINKLLFKDLKLTAGRLHSTEWMFPKVTKKQNVFFFFLNKFLERIYDCFEARKTLITKASGINFKKIKKVSPNTINTLSS